MTGAIVSYQQEDSIKLQCKIYLKNNLPSRNKENDLIKSRKDFLESDPCNKEII